MTQPRRILTLGHSYVVGMNRRLAHEIARVGAGRWEVVCAAPQHFQGSRDLRAVTLEPIAGEPTRLVGLPAYLTGRVHVFAYGLPLRSLLAEGWDVVHCWEEPYILAGRQVAGWLPRGASLVYVTCQNLPKSYPPPFAGFERTCLVRAAGWVGIGQTVHDTLAQRPAYRGRPGCVIPLGVDMQRFCPDPAARKAVRGALGWPEDGVPVVGYLGRFIPEKGLLLLTRALAALKGPWRALFVGGGEDEPFLREWARPYGDRVQIRNDVKHDQVPAFLNAMDVLCAPSQTTPRWREQFGRMLIEGFACGLSVIGSDSGEIPHVIGDAGLVVGEKDESGWIRTLETVLGDDALRRDLARRGIERVHGEFAWPVVGQRYLDFFETVQAGGRT